jgi:hypothetical protein
VSLSQALRGPILLLFADFFAVSLDRRVIDSQVRDVALHYNATFVLVGEQRCLSSTSTFAAIAATSLRPVGEIKSIARKA